MVKPLSKRKLKEKVKEKLYAGIVQPVDTFQKRPNTCVVFDVNYEGVTHNCIGFSKVSWPDEWDTDYGVNMAIEKAISDLAKRLIAAKPIISLYEV
jgi:hypothetical protein